VNPSKLAAFEILPSYGNHSLPMIRFIFNKPLPANASQPAAQPRGPARSKACAINSNTVNSTGLGCSEPASQPTHHRSKV